MATERFIAVWNGREVSVDVARFASRLRVSFDNEVHDLDLRRLGDGTYSVLVDGESYEVELEQKDERVDVGLRGRRYTFEVLDERRARMRLGRARLGGDGPQVVLSPMPGRVVRIDVKAGERVAAGQPVAVVEAMKMENELRAAREGVVREVTTAPGKAVEAGEKLLVIG
jgi:biotin carboxyl carrier protein